MRIFLITLILLVSMTVSAQTLSETIEWLDGKLNYSYKVITKTNYVFYAYNQKIEFNNATKTLTIFS